MDDALRKLFIHSMLQIDPEEKERPMTLREEKGILEKFSGDIADSVHFAIIKQRDEPGKLFSQNALQRFLHTIRLFIGGRIIGHFDKTQQSPEVVVVTIQVEHITKAEYEKRCKS